MSAFKLRGSESNEDTEDLSTRNIWEPSRSVVRKYCHKTRNWQRFGASVTDNNRKAGIA